MTDQKVQAAEEAYTHAKQLYDEISDELYEELPSFYDRYLVDSYKATKKWLWLVKDPFT